ncbi:hypothetical protein MC7420_2234 [Coleofasciculus chthonoplastes PCC 7420]|uniref:Uncharacterized protein n=1 Tax=Coleofasciculus chthonoplastes PCC 7420 TaxID=118168 RepID=B4VS02_9CYAN|nr:hypothetical protein MC7420_2234 [Coleofasciculus chthonoplastes PCC 7420]
MMSPPFQLGYFSSIPPVLDDVGMDSQPMRANLMLMGLFPLREDVSKVV